MQFSNLSAIDNIYLDVIGSQIDKIYGKFFDVIKRSYNITEKSVIPFYFSAPGKYLPIDKWELGMQFTQSVPNSEELFSVDIFEIMPVTNTFEYLSKGLQFTGEESFTSCGAMKIKLNYNHIVSHLFLSVNDVDDKYINDQIKTLSIVFINDTIIKLEYDLNSLEIYSDHYVIDLGLGINFSKCDQVIVNIEFTNTVSGYVNIYGLYTQGIKVSNDLFGLTFSK